jgi:chain length determinant protein EpsF
MKNVDVKAKAARESHIVTIQYTASDPAFAAAAANAFAQAYIETNVEMKADPARQFARWFEEQRKALRENIESAQQRLSQHHREYGIVSSEERLDIETAKLSDLSTQLTAVIGQTTEARSKQRVGTGQTLPDVAQNPVIQDLKSQIARAEARREELSSHMGVNHPDYQNVEAMVASLKKRLAVEAQSIVSAFSAAHAVNKQREAELRDAIEVQKRKLLTIKLARDQLDVLRRDVDAAHKAYDMVSQRIHQTTLEGKLTQSDAGILTMASEPMDPSFPQLALNVAIAIFLGILGGVAIAFILEVLDRRVHSRDDLIWGIQLSVLGAVERVKVRGSHVRLPRRVLRLLAAH